MKTIHFSVWHTIIKLAVLTILLTGCEDLLPGNDPPAAPTTPDPLDNAVDQPVDLNLTWTCTDPNNDPLTFDVFFGTENNPPSKPPLVAKDIVQATYNPGNLAYGTTYYWRILARDDSGEEFSSSTWSFTTIQATGNQPPSVPEVINPLNQEENTGDCILLSWRCSDPEGDPLKYDLYFGTNTPPPLMEENVDDTIFDPGALDQSTQYFWKIIAKDDQDNSTPGPEWNFTTRTITDEGPCDGIATVTDASGNVYNTIQVGNQCWMKENLKTGVMVIGWSNMTDNGITERFCHYNDEENCDLYGALYKWDEMMNYTSAGGAQGICPDGWHIPTDDEFKILEGFVDCRYSAGDPEWDKNGWRGVNAGLNLKSTDGWDNNGNGPDPFGFNWKPGGLFAPTGWYSFRNAAIMWTSDVENGTEAWYRTLVPSWDDIRRDRANIENTAVSVRCIKNQ